MKTFIIASTSNYGLTVVMTNADSLEEATETAEKHSTVWPGYTITEWDTERKQTRTIEDY